jgi:hypothetical protein
VRNRPDPSLLTHTRGLRPLSLGAAMEDRRCPRCSSDEVLRVVYGLPSEEMIEESIAGRVLLFWLRSVARGSRLAVCGLRPRVARR